VSNVVIRFGDRAKGSVSAPLVLWALAMTVVLFIEVVAPSAAVTTWGFAVTAVLGIYLGWQRRLAAVMLAPFLSWLFARSLDDHLRVDWHWPGRIRVARDGGDARASGPRRSA
jgi:hypothetical protein